MKRLACSALLAAVLHALLFLVEGPRRTTPRRIVVADQPMRLHLVSRTPSNTPTPAPYERTADTAEPARPAQATSPSPRRVTTPPKTSSSRSTAPPPKAASKPPPVKKALPKKKPIQPPVKPEPVAAKTAVPSSKERQRSGKVEPEKREEKARSAAPVGVTDTAPLEAALPPRPAAAVGHGDTTTDPATDASSDIREAYPLYSRNPPPAYPRKARRRGYEGVVALAVLVGRDGRVKTLRVERGSGYRLLDRAALRAVRGWRFQPGSENGRQVEMWVEVPIRFRLQSP